MIQERANLMDMEKVMMSWRIQNVRRFLAPSRSPHILKGCQEATKIWNTLKNIENCAI